MKGMNENVWIVTRKVTNECVRCSLGVALIEVDNMRENRLIWYDMIVF